MKPAAALLCIALCTVAAHAQATWKGLHFGQSREQVRAELAAQNIATETSQEGSLQTTADYDLFLPSLAHTLPFHVSFHFTDAGGLMDVSLTLDLLGMRRYWSILGPDEAMIHFAGEHLAGALSGRYGAPLYHTPSCEPDAKQNSICIVSWRGAEQTVELERLPSPRGPRLVVRYQMLATDL